jgi:hypothetical protein
MLIETLIIAAAVSLGIIEPRPRPSPACASGGYAAVFALIRDSVPLLMWTSAPSAVLIITAKHVDF